MLLDCECLEDRCKIMGQAGIGRTVLRFGEMREEGRCEA